MQQNNTINPDQICQQAIQAKLNVYQAKEQFETVLKVYNDRLDNLINLVSLMKNRILELEGELDREKMKNKDSEKEEAVSEKQTIKSSFLPSRKQFLRQISGVLDRPYCLLLMGFILVKKGVFESMEYPWFKPIEKKIGNMVDFTMEDVAFCLTAREKGFEIYVDPTVRVGHEKKVIL